VVARRGKIYVRRELRDPDVTTARETSCRRDASWVRRKPAGLGATIPGPREVRATSRNDQK